MSADETAPLLPGGSGSGAGTAPRPPADGAAKQQQQQGRSRPTCLERLFHVENRILLAGFLISLSFSFTQVPLLYVFRLMTCDAFYDRRPPYTGDGDRCARNEIAAGTATQFSILGITTTLCGTINLFVAGWAVKKWGAKTAILFQTFVPAIRVLAQILGVMAGKRLGMNIIQGTQLITILGGPVGYILVINIIAGEVVTPIRRTAVFGMLQGCFMLGQSLGNFTGGLLGDAFGVRAPFDVACGFFLVSCVYVLVSLPYIPPPVRTDKSSKSSGGFLAPLRILAPQKLRLASGQMSKHYGVVLLCAGIFLGVLATDYAPLLIQMYATAAFNFSQASNGLLMSEFALMRGIFLLFLFPRLIALGRRLLASKRLRSEPSPAVREEGYGTDGTLTPDSLPTDPRQFDASMGTIPSDEPVKPTRPKEDQELDPQFDLTFLRWSLVVDGAFTTVAAFATESWHIYLAAFLLPFGSGSAPAAKGVITSMCSDAQRADALNAVTLVENIARLSTQGLFGFVFAVLANVGKAYATFFCNAAIAVVAVSVLLLSHFPPDGSVLVDSIAEGEEQLEE
ncbi:Major facilitator superfamily transporter [Cordyceps militaris]|uniref:Major facilitator superfamily transporter n=1 Tax=Cordyceps militaris TaxID=73501 RepID=A0A2H4S8W5_CORMI|nr:Major facilitator superfamily transporter [Cordyceps militaris]